jgi:HD-like signal output (HDOD) protein
MISQLGISTEELQKRVNEMASIPCVSAIIQPLISYLGMPFESQDMQRIVDLVSHDNSLTAQCLHMANSPLYGRCQPITTARAAVIALGLQRMREIVLSCSMLKMMPAGTAGDATVFWEHSLACAFVARRLAKRIGVRDPEQVYMAGLLHDLGFVVNLRIEATAFAEAVRIARSRRCDITIVEEELLGFTHCQSGSLLAEQWKLGAPIQQTIRHHHAKAPGESDHSSLVALITFSDRVCRRHGVGYGYEEDLAVLSDSHDLVRAFVQTWPSAANVNWAQVCADMEEYLKDVRKLVSVLFRL